MTMREARQIIATRNIELAVATAEKHTGICSKCRVRAQLTFFNGQMLYCPGCGEFTSHRKDIQPRYDQ